MSYFKSIAVFVVFQTIALGAVCPAIDAKPSDLDVIKSEIQSALDRMDISMKAKDMCAIGSAFAQSEELLSIGLDSQTFGWDSLQKALKQQMEIVNDYQNSLIDRRIIVDTNGKRARYYQRYSMTFEVHPFTFHMPEVRETGIVEKIDGSWVIIHQHTSIPVTNDIWPAYITTDRDDPGKYDLHRQFGVDELAEDFDLLLLALEEAHTGLFRYTHQDRFQQLVQNTKEKITQSMTECEFYRIVCPIVANIKCGHTSISPSCSYSQYVREKGKYFPLKLKFLSGKAFVVINSSQSDIPLGSEIISIDDRSMKEIMPSMFKCMCADGDILSAKYRHLDDSFAKKYHLLVEQPDTFKLVYIPYKNQLPRTTTIKAIHYQKLKENGFTHHSSSKDILKLEIKENSNVAILTIKKFVNSEIEALYQSFKHFLDAAFKEIEEKNIHHLIIDIRGNGGGDVAHQLLAYIMDKPVQFYRSIDTPRTRYSFLEYTDNGVFFNRVHPHLWKKTRNRENRYELVGNYHHTIEPNPIRFKGKVYILIDGNSFSASAEFASVVHYHRRATFIGEETGGAYYGNNAGDFLKLTLPHTKLRVSIPIRRYVMAVADYPNKTRGIIPDYEMEPTIDDILTDHDRVMEFTLNHIKKHDIEDDRDRKQRR